MEQVLETVVARCRAALVSRDPQGAVEVIVGEAMRDPAVAAAIAPLTEFARLDDLAIHRSAEMTVLAGTMPPGFVAGPHNHNIWSVVGVCSGQEDNSYFERDGEGLRQVGAASVTGPGVLPNPADVIHAIRNPLDEPLVVFHVYGGDLFATERSSWNPETHEETVFDWSQVAGN